MNKKKILSLIMALVMLVGVFSPLSALAAEGTDAKKDPNISTKPDAVTNKVTLHKLMMKEKELTDWVQITEDKYDGTQKTEDLLKNLAKGHSAHEVADVYFALKYAKDYGTNDTEKAMAGKYVKASATDKLTPADPLAATDNVDEAVGGLTTANGIEFKTSTLKGKFEIDEITKKTTYKKADGSVITSSKAVPVEITLPLVNSKGTVLEAHVYPKNTENKPQIDKNFGKKDNTKDNKTANDLAHAEGFDAAQAGAQEGAKYENYTKTKETAKAEIGKTIPYEVKTKIPANSKLATAKWDDKMTEGLTYNKDLVVKINGTKINPTTDELVQTDNGFELNLKGDNLALLNGKDKDVEVELQYTAKVNKDAMADIPESNDITFHYGNNPGHGNTPVPNKPSDDGELKVTKTWADGKWAKNEKAKFKIIDANTGKDITADDLVEPADASKKAEFEAYKKAFKAEQEIGYTEGATKGEATWKYLDKNREYKVVETSVTYTDKNKEVKTLTGWEAEYAVNGKGETTIKNYLTNNPTPLNPTEPKVVVGGKKFVKTNDKEKTATDLERLAGAEFYVKKTVTEKGKQVDKYLVSAKKDANAVKTAKDALDAAVKVYNALDADKQTDDEKAKVTTAQEAYNKAFKENATEYTWGSKDDANVVILTSDGQGRFEITGLEYGSYKLEEKTPPKDYAKIADQDFTVAKGTYAGTDAELQYNKDDTKAGYGQQVKNKKVTIPQTGGMGTVLFTIVGISLMAGAVIAMKKNREEA